MRRYSLSNSSSPAPVEEIHAEEQQEETGRSVGSRRFCLVPLSCGSDGSARLGGVNQEEVRRPEEAAVQNPGEPPCDVVLVRSLGRSGPTGSSVCFTANL